MESELEQIERELNKLRGFEDSAFELPTLDQYMEEIERLWELKIPLLFKKYKLSEIIFKKELSGDFGDLMTVQDFIDNCKWGGFIDSDGSGTYASSTHESNIPAIPSMIAEGMVINDPKLTHVIWFNK